MPQVGKKKFPYTPKGKKAAKVYAKKTDKPLKDKKKDGTLGNDYSGY